MVLAPPPRPPPPPPGGGGNTPPPPPRGGGGGGGGGGRVGEGVPGADTIPRPSPSRAPRPPHRTPNPAKAAALRYRPCRSSRHPRSAGQAVRRDRHRCRRQPLRAPAMSPAVSRQPPDHRLAMRQTTVPRSSGR